jgi:hypothetical protein
MWRDAVRALPAELAPRGKKGGERAHVLRAPLFQLNKKYYNVQIKNLN